MADETLQLGEQFTRLNPESELAVRRSFHSRRVADDCPLCHATKWCLSLAFLALAERQLPVILRICESCGHILLFDRDIIPPSHSTEGR